MKTIRSYFLVSLVICLNILAVSKETHADVSVVQTKCEKFTQENLNFLRVHLSVVNFSLPTIMCDLHFIPEPLPSDPACEIVDCVSPDGWSCFLDPSGGASWFANTPSDCISTESFKSGFEIVLPVTTPIKDFCCYIVQFTGPTGEILLEQEECFICKDADQCAAWLTADQNDDCFIDFRDLAIFACQWLACGNTLDPNCQKPPCLN